MTFTVHILTIVAIWRENMLGYLSADIICSEKRTVFREQSSKENCELRGTDNVQGQISEHIFAPNGDYWLYYPSNLFRMCAVLKIGEYSRIFPSFSWGIFGHMMRLGQSRVSKKIWWIINIYTLYIQKSVGNEIIKSTLSPSINNYKVTS